MDIYVCDGFCGRSSSCLLPLSLTYDNSELVLRIAQKWILTTGDDDDTNLHIVHFLSAEKR